MNGIVLIAANLDQTEAMFQQLNNKSNKVSLEVNLSKTKVKTNIDDACQKS